MSRYRKLMYLSLVCMGLAWLFGVPQLIFAYTLVPLGASQKLLSYDTAVVLGWSLVVLGLISLSTALYIVGSASYCAQCRKRIWPDDRVYIAGDRDSKRFCCSDTCQRNEEWRMAGG